LYLGKEHDCTEAKVRGMEFDALRRGARLFGVEKRGHYEAISHQPLTALTWLSDETQPIIGKELAIT
jgi:hypothetical protein